MSDLPPNSSSPHAADTNSSGQPAPGSFCGLLSGGWYASHTLGSACWPQRYDALGAALTSTWLAAGAAPGRWLYRAGG